MSAHAGIPEPRKIKLGDLKAAESRGRKAYQEGRSLFSCTYADRAMCEAWEAGWEAARAKGGIGRGITQETTMKAKPQREPESQGQKQICFYCHETLISERNGRNVRHMESGVAYGKCLNAVKAANKKQ